MGDFQRVMMFLHEHCHILAYIRHMIYRYPAYTERLGSFLVGGFKDGQPSLWIIGKTWFQSQKTAFKAINIRKKHDYPATLWVG